jgi:hypothetical protein
VLTLQYKGFYCPLSFGLRNFETIQYALCHCKFSCMINQKFMKLCTLQDPNKLVRTYRWTEKNKFDLVTLAFDNQ